MGGYSLLFGPVQYGDESVGCVVMTLVILRSVHQHHSSEFSFQRLPLLVLILGQFMYLGWLFG